MIGHSIEGYGSILFFGLSDALMMRNLSINYFLKAYLICISAATILFLPSMVPGKFLTMDGDYYLQYAQLFKDGDFFSYFLYGKIPLMGVWPFGFPMLIGGVATVTGLEVFWAGRLVQLFLFFLMLWLLWKKFGQDWFFYFTLLATGIFLYNHLFTLSEAGFIVLGLAFLIAFERHQSIPAKVLVIILPLLIFSFRYVGVFVLLFLAVNVLLGYQKKLAWISMLLLLVFVVTYFYSIYIQTGQFSGLERQGGIVSRPTMFGQFFLSTAALFSYFDIGKFQGKVGAYLFFVGTVPFIILLVSLFKEKPIREIFLDMNAFSKNAMIFGGCYLILYLSLTLGLGWDHDGEGIIPRFLYPGFIFLILGFFYQVTQKVPIRNFHRQLLLGFAITNHTYYALSGFLLN